MPVFAPYELATIAPEDAAAAHRSFERYYASTLAALAALDLRWRIDVETREPGQSPEQQHQLVIWDPQLRRTYGLRLWLREDGTLDGPPGGLPNGERLTAAALLGRVQRYRKGWAVAQQTEDRHCQRRAALVKKLRWTLYLFTTAFILITALAAALFGATIWVRAGRTTSTLLLVMSLVADAWMQWQLHRGGPEPSSPKEPI